MMAGLTVMAGVAASLIAMKAGIAARIAVEIAAYATVEIAAEIMADVRGNVQIKGVAPKANQRQEKLNDQDRSANGGADDEYGFHFLTPLNQLPQRGDRTRTFMMNEASPLSIRHTPYMGQLVGHG